MSNYKYAINTLVRSKAAISYPGTHYCELHLEISIFTKWRMSRQLKQVKSTKMYELL